MTLRTLLDRYIFTELLYPFSVSLGMLCFIMLTRELLRLVELLVTKGVGSSTCLPTCFHPFLC
jgi:lipopolysaccharide export system permease protein